MTTFISSLPGWGENINWHALSECWNEAKSKNKPVMCVIHKPTCPACMRLRRAVSNSDEISKLSQDFVMVNLEWHEAPSSQDFAPDGRYIPRVIFFTPGGNALLNVVNRKDGDTKYAYSSVQRLTENMKEVRDQFQPQPGQGDGQNGGQKSKRFGLF